MGFSLCRLILNSPPGPDQGVFLSQTYNSSFTGIQATGNFSILVYFYVFYYTRLH